MALTTIKRATKNKLNNDIWELLKPTYFDTIMLGAVMNILEKYGYTVLQEDNTPWDGFICGHKGQEYFPIGTKQEDGTYKEITNALLTLSWYKMSSGRYEVISYVT